MNWKELPSSTFSYCNKKVTRRKFQFNTIFGLFEIYEAVSGNTFIRHPFLKNYYLTRLPDDNGILPNEIFMDNGLEEWFGKPKLKVKDIEEGKEKCENVMKLIKQIILTY